MLFGTEYAIWLPKFESLRIGLMRWRNQPPVRSFMEDLAQQRIASLGSSSILRSQHAPQSWVQRWHHRLWHSALNSNAC
jgi:hypothetical protein